MTDDLERAQHIRREIVAGRELCERRVWGESALRSRNAQLITSVPGLLAMLEETLARLASVTEARDEAQNLGSGDAVLITSAPLRKAAIKFAAAMKEHGQAEDTETDLHRAALVFADRVAELEKAGVG